MRPYRDRLQLLPQPALPEVPGAASRRWLADREAELLPVPYFHVVYTLPSELASIAYQNKAVVYDLLMKAAAETTLAIAADPKRLGARIGITAVLHTWGSALTHHPHVHMIVPGGGLSLDGARWVASRPTSSSMSRCWRACSAARCWRCSWMRTRDRLKFFNAHAALADKRTFKRFIAPLRRSSGWSTARHRSRGPSRCCAISPVTPIVSPSRTAASLQPTTAASRSAGRTTASTVRTAGRRCGCTRTSSSAASSARAAQGLPPHPPLRLVRQRHHRAEQLATRARAARGMPAPASQPTQAETAMAPPPDATDPASPLPSLRRPHDRSSRRSRAATQPRHRHHHARSQSRSTRHDRCVAIARSPSHPSRPLLIGQRRSRSPCRPFTAPPMPIANQCPTLFRPSTHPTPTLPPVGQAVASTAESTVVTAPLELNPHSPAAPAVLHLPRFRALALFGRRPPERVDGAVMPASENLHRTRHDPAKDGDNDRTDGHYSWSRA